MKYFCLLLCIFTGQSVWAGDLKVEVHGTGMAGKTVYAAVFAAAHAKDFPLRDEYSYTGNTLATSDVVEIQIHDVAFGDYAVAVFEDINGNGKLDTNFLGMPKEPTGMSRDAKGNFGPPKFADAAFKIGDGITPMRIQLH